MRHWRLWSWLVFWTLLSAVCNQLGFGYGTFACGMFAGIVLNELVIVLDSGKSSETNG